MRLSSTLHRRRGVVLVLFALLVFALMGLAALLIDMGIARLTQRQMQSAADTAALEGLRGRDPATLDPDRTLASELVKIQFDDDLNSAHGDHMQFGAGPRLTLIDTQGVSDVGNLNAGQLLTVGDPPVYKPVLQLNAEDAVPGDLVSGSYQGDLLPHGESADYVREDFVPHSVDLALPRNALLVRLRRTNDFQGLDDLSGVSSSGEALPLLFGRGTLIQAADPSSGYSARHHGISVRATAIAQARPALTVGPVIVDGELAVDGIAPVALQRTFWLGMGADVVTLAVNATGGLGTTGGSGQLIQANNFVSIGRRVTELATTQLPVLSDDQRPRSIYVPLFESIAGPNGSENWLVGFGRVTIDNLAPLQLRRETGILAARNASAVLIQGESNSLPADAPLDEIFTIHRALGESADSRLLVVTAPALVR